jgi:hypothetical protein
MRRIATPSSLTQLPLRSAPRSRVLIIIALLAAVAAGGCGASASAATTARAGAGGRGAATAAQAGTRGVLPASVLVNQPASTVCVGRTFRVGVWYQPSGGSRAYRLAVYNPRGRRVFYRHGQAPSKHWAFWRIRARMAGRYRTVYSGHWKSRSVWSQYKATTRARRC